jgi:hypothetical protein
MVRLRNQLSDTLWTRMINADCSARVVCTYILFFSLRFRNCNARQTSTYFSFMKSQLKSNFRERQKNKQIENEKDIYFLKFQNEMLSAKD